VIEAPLGMPRAASCNDTSLEVLDFIGF